MFLGKSAIVVEHFYNKTGFKTAPNGGRNSQKKTHAKAGGEEAVCCLGVVGGDHMRE